MASDPDRELWVYITPGVIAPTKGVPPREAHWASGKLAAIVAETGIDRLESIYPDWNRADTVGVSRLGLRFHRMDQTGFFKMRLPPSKNRDEVLRVLRASPDVIACGPNERINYRGVIQPNDPKLKLQWYMQNLGQSNGKVWADVRVRGAWNANNENGITTADTLAIVDGGVDGSHPELSGRVLGQSGTDIHATSVAGIAAASGNNGAGIAGVRWHAAISSQIIANGDAIGAAQAIDRAVAAGAQVINASWGFTTSSLPLETSLANAYKANCLVIAANPTSISPGIYPASYKSLGVLSVSATNNLDGSPASYALQEAFVDVSAPGGNNDGTMARDIYSTVPGASYGYSFGTSYAAPMVTGLASMVRVPGHCDEFGCIGYPWNDDLRGEILSTADDLGVTGWDQTFGYGRINAGRAWSNQTHDTDRFTATGGSLFGSDSPLYTVATYGIPGLSPGAHHVIRSEYRVNVTWSSRTNPMAWGRGNSSLGWPLVPDQSDCFGNNFCEVVPGTMTSTGCTLRTYLYKVFTLTNVFIGWFPTSPGNQVYAYTAKNMVSPPTGDPSATQSYFVPQADSIVNPTEGTPALQYFRACPNNDGTQVLAHNARIKVVAKNAAGAPIAGIPAGEIFVVLNGGSAAQGFTGAGADSMIANSEFNSSPLCPDLREIAADATTDANGVTYITLRGATPGLPGTATRDPQRKWGHYDSEMSVYIRGTKLVGRLTSGSPNPVYQLAVKSLDLVNGLTTTPNVGEAVTSDDYNDVVAHNNQADSVDPVNWWRDFDNSGTVNSLDISLIAAHVNHGCTSPFNP